MRGSLRSSSGQMPRVPSGVGTVLCLCLFLQVRHATGPKATYPVHGYRVVSCLSCPKSMCLMEYVHLSSPEHLTIDFLPGSHVAIIVLNCSLNHVSSHDAVYPYGHVHGHERISLSKGHAFGICYITTTKTVLRSLTWCASAGWRPALSVSQPLDRNCRVRDQTENMTKGSLLSCTD